MRVLLHTGKGGVGKTSLALATALGAAEHGHRVFVVSTDSAHSLGDALGRKVGPRPLEVAPRVMAQEVAALTELDRAWSEIQTFLTELFREENAEIAAEELLVFPGSKSSSPCALCAISRLAGTAMSASWIVRPPVRPCVCCACPMCCASS